LNKRSKLLLLVLLAKPISGFGQQQPASSFESLVAAAQQAQSANDFAAAVNNYKQAVRIQPDMPELWANLGLVEQQAGNIPEALQSFLHANRLNPSLYVPNLFLGIDNLRTGNATHAIPYLLNAEKINKSDPQAPLALGRAYFSTHKFTASAEQLNRAIALNPKLGQAWFTLGMTRLDQVEVDSRTISTEGKDSSFSIALYAGALQKQGRFKEAAASYRSLLNSNPQPPCIRSELGIALLRDHDQAGAASRFADERVAHPECSLALLGEARIALDSNDYDHALGLLKELWNRDHGFVESNAAILLDGLSNEKAVSTGGLLTLESRAIPADLRNVLLIAFNLSSQDSGNRSGESESAVPASVPSSASSPTAEELYATGQFQQCERKLNPALVAGRADKLRLLARCAFFTGDNERVSDAATALEGLQPNSLEALYWSIQANERLALQSLARFQQLEPDSARSHALLGAMYHQLERESEAQAEYQKALALDPGDPAAMLGLAWAYLGNNNTKQAIETAQMALQRTPEDPDLNLVMAESLVVMNRYAEAEPFLLKSLKVKPQILAHVHALIGKVYAETGRTQEAIGQLKMAVSNDNNGSIHYQLAQLYRQVGDTKDASDAIDQVKAIKQQRHDQGVKLVEDPDLSAVESPPDQSSNP
jgi:tetratricopeptide (TPR) repeat protein